VSRHKRHVFEELIDEIRRSQNATDRFDQAVADALGMNRTDMRCIDVLQREGPVTAGRLAEATGLTTGAMTTALDRLERAGYARRTRDAADRRRVVVELTPKVFDDIMGF
jgi:DNA-binding MarR family transcriptional regulator